MKYVIRLLSILLLDVLCMAMPIIAHTHTNTTARVILFIIAGVLIELRASYEVWVIRKEQKGGTDESMDSKRI